MTTTNDAEIGYLEIIDKDECFELLKYPEIGRLGFHDGTKIVVFPVNYTLVNHTIVFLTGPGAKVEAARRRKEATFEVDEIDGNFREGWSVMVFGKLGHYQTLSAPSDATQYTCRPWARGVKPYALAVEPVTMTGRRISHGPMPDTPWQI